MLITLIFISKVLHEDKVSQAQGQSGIAFRPFSKMAAENSNKSKMAPGQNEKRRPALERTPLL